MQGIARAFSIVVALAAALVLPATALAHGIQGRVDLPVPIKLFYWASAIVLIVSFVALALGWSKARWSAIAWRPAPAWLHALVYSPVTAFVTRAVTLALLVLAIVAALFGSTELNDNIAPYLVFVVWFIGLVPLSVMFGNVWRHVNPWASIARLLGFKSRGSYPARWGVWPAVGLFLVFTWLELVYPTAAHIRLMGWLVVAYSVLTLAGMWRYGVEDWLDHGEAFSVYTGVLSRLSVVDTRKREGLQQLGFRAPLIGVTRMRPTPGMVAFIGVLIGTVSFDGLSRSGWWQSNSAEAVLRLASGGLGTELARYAVTTAGFAALIVFAVAAFEFASWVADRIGGLSAEMSAGRVAQAFMHSLVPIALAYNVAHYFSFFVFQAQEAIRLASDPLGRGWDLFGTADREINYDLLSANTIWLVQVGAIVVGHVVGLVLAHDRALELTDHSRRAVRSQWAMLALMIVYTVGGLWFLSEGLT
jgi:hypothetical protein